MDKELTQYATSEALATRQALYAFATGPSRADHVRDALDGFHGMSLLDAGCGNGTLVLETIKPFVDVDLSLLDPSPEMVREAVSLCARPKTTGLVGDMGAMSLGRFFDRILVAHALHLVDDKAAAIGNVVRHLAPQGRAVITMHSGTDFPKRREWISWFEKTFANNYRAKRDSLNFQNFSEIARFVPGAVASEIVHTNIRLTDAEPYLRYLGTERHRWEREPTDAEWTAYFDHVREDIQREIRERGAFTEQHDWGLATIQLA